MNYTVVRGRNCNDALQLVQCHTINHETRNAILNNNNNTATAPQGILTFTLIGPGANADADEIQNNKNNFILSLFN